jgi:hypothetical protein
MDNIKLTHNEYSKIRLQGTKTLQDFDHFWVDTVDLNTMVDDLQAALYPRYNQSFVAYFREPHNPEKLDRCEFGMHSKMIKGLQPSVEFYRNFTLERIG